MSSTPPAAVLTFRAATEADLPAIVQLLAADPLGATRERFEMPLPDAYHRAFAATHEGMKLALTPASTPNSQ